MPRIATGCRHCGIAVTPGPEPICRDCYDNPPVWQAGYAVATYRNAARDLVLRLKHGGDEGLAQIAANMMLSAHRQSLVDVDRIFAMPLHWRRRLSRGYNQSALMAGHLAKGLGVKIDRHSLVRTRHTRPQSADFDAGARRANVADAFAYRGSDLTGQRVLIVDDVLTSGASLSAAAHAIMPANPRQIDIIVFARAPQKH